MPRSGIFLIIITFALTGCAATGGSTLTAADYARLRPQLRTVAVMPLKLNLIQVQAGGNAELIDEWRDEAAELMTAALTRQLAEEQGLQPVFAEEDYLRQYHQPLWRRYRSLFETITGAALRHGYGVTALPSKTEHLDYTLGPGISELAALFDADALLFVYGTDNTSTAGRKMVAMANLGMVDYNYDSLVMALVDARSGDYLWLKRSAPLENMNLRDAPFVERTVEWMFTDFSAPAE